MNEYLLVFLTLIYCTFGIILFVIGITDIVSINKGEEFDLIEKLILFLVLFVGLFLTIFGIVNLIKLAI